MNTISGEQLVTPKELAQAGVMSTVKQWAARKEGLLNCYRVGSKVLYSWRKHIEPYLERQNNSNEITGENND